MVIRPQSCNLTHYWDYYFYAEPCWHNYALHRCKGPSNQSKVEHQGLQLQYTWVFIMFCAEKVSAKEAYLEGFKGNTDWKTGTIENHSKEEGNTHSQVKQNKGTLKLKINLSRYISYLWVNKSKQKSLLMLTAVNDIWNPGNSKLNLWFYFEA